MKKSLRKLAIYPLTAAIALFAHAGIRTYVDLRGNSIIKEHAMHLSDEQAKQLFQETISEYGLDKKNIELVLDGNSNSLGLTEMVDGGYRISLSEPYNDVIIRHELSHVDDLVADRFYLRSLPNLISWADSELRAQNRSIER